MRISRPEASRHNGHSAVVALLAVVLVFSGCGEEASGPSSEWTVAEGTLNFTETLRAGDDEPYFFGNIRDVTVGPDGLIHVADAKSSRVQVLRPDGSLRHTIGQAGMGPGDFRRPADVYVSRADSLYILDGDFRGLVSVFGPQHEFVRRTSLRSKYIPDRPKDILHISRDSGYLVGFGSIPDPQEGRGKSKVRRVSFSGTLGNTLFTYPPAQQPYEKIDSGLRFYLVPYIRSGIVRGDSQGQVHFAWKDSLGVRSYGPEGKLERMIDVPFEPVPVTEGDLDQKLSDVSEEKIAELKEKDILATTKTAFEHFLVDDGGRYWFGRPTADPDTMSWWLVWPEEKEVATTTLPSEVQLYDVHNGSVYGKTTDNGAPVVVRYEIQTDN